MRMADDDESEARENTESTDAEHVIRVFDDPAEIDAATWDALVAAQPSATPFVSMAYLRALHESASAVADTGWAPHFLVLERAGKLVAACPLYLKDHSYGEYVFDWAWADAYRRHGLDYYPKLLDAVPFTPVPGPRLLARTRRAPTAPAARDRAARAIGPSSRRRTCSSSTRPTRRRAREAGWSLRTHRAVPLDATARRRRTPTSPTSWPACSATSARRSSRSGAASPTPASASRSRPATQIAEADWDFFYRCYTLTYRAHHSTPYLTRDFFARIGGDDGAQLAALHRLARRQAHRRRR